MTFWEATAPTFASAKAQRAATAMLEVASATPSIPVRSHRPTTL